MRKQRGNNEETIMKHEENNEETSVGVNAMFSTQNCFKFKILLMYHCSLSINRNNEILKLRYKL